MTHSQREQLARTGVLNLGQVLEGEELDSLRGPFDADRANYHYSWHHYGYHHQQANFDALIISPAFG